jgi:hypothetical protein
MNASIKITSVGGATLSAGVYGSNQAGDFNFPIDKFGATDNVYNGDGAYNILLKGNTDATPNASFGGYTSYKFYITGSTKAENGKAFSDAIVNNNGSGESIVKLPAGAEITGWEITNVNY